jgi:hypothetical protein
MKRVRQYYGWYDATAEVYLLSKLPPDALVRKPIAFKELADLKAEVERRRGQVYWWPIPPGMTAADNNPTPIPTEKFDLDAARAAAADLQRRQQATHSESAGDDIWKGWPLP